ncbi:MAG: DUF3817 domain-containing protein [Acidimicrobiales bacterium]
MTDPVVTEARRLRTAVRCYQVMAIVVGVLLIVLVAIAIPLQYAWGRPGLAGVVAPVHGFCYIVYLVTVAILARRGRLGLRQIVAMVLAGFVPVLAFVVERRFTARWNRELGVTRQPRRPS